MLDGQPVHVVRAVVVHDDLPVMPPTQQLLALPGAGEIGEGRLAQLQPPPVEPIRAVHVDRPPHVVHVVEDEGAAVEQHARPLPVGGARAKPLGQLIGGHGGDPLQHQLPLQGVALGRRAGRQADRLQLAPFGRLVVEVLVVEVVVVVEVVAMAVVEHGVAVGAADARPAQAALGPVARRAAVHAAARRRAGRQQRGPGGRRRGGGRQEGGGRAGRRRGPRLAQAAVQHEFQVVAGAGGGRDRLAADQGGHGR